MGLLKKVEKIYSHYQERRIGTFEFPEKLTNENAYRLALSVSEIFWCIDFIADRLSKLRFFIADKSGTEIENTELNRFITSPNPIYSLGDLVYQMAFDLFSDGNIFILPRAPEFYGQLTQNNITRIDILRPSELSLRESQKTILDVSRLNDLIQDVRINTKSVDKVLSPEQRDALIIKKIDSTIRPGSSFLSQSPLFRALRPINNLLAAYSARYNSYVNNGNAGIIFKKSKSGLPGPGQALDFNTGSVREKIIDDFKDRNGLTGNRNFVGITDQEIGYINTLGTIKDLMPFEETLEDTIKIASVFQIPPQLVPRRDNSTFDNQGESERSVWENSLMSAADMICETLTRAFYLKKEKIRADYSTVSALNENKSDLEDLRAKQIANLNSLMAVDEAKVKDILNNIILDYEEGR